jgi:hypothetical protein
MHAFFLSFTLVSIISETKAKTNIHCVVSISKQEIHLALKLSY